MTKQIHITAIKDNEQDILRSLSIQTFLDTYAAANIPENINTYLANSFSVQRLDSELNNPNSQFYFARTEDAVAGYLKVNTGEAQTEHDLENAAEIERIYAAKAYHGKGVGKALIQHAVMFASAANVRWLWLGVWEENTHAIEFYNRQGFEVFGTHNFLMGDEPQRDLMMRLSIK
jgi:ribosomal protein S18 acetylase RimI-like enzyme